MKTENVDLYNKALSFFGYDAQEKMLFEECSELVFALCKHSRGLGSIRSIITELADVHIMVEQMALFYGMERFTEEKNRKINRLKERLNFNPNY